MRLKHIKLAGFKSFVDATTVPFPDQMTAIVGPNGCGKSNVIDAVRWVLGESSAKNLRGDAMTDVIFNGSSNRKPVSQASVELVFDNTEGRLEGNLADRTEISVKRQVNKDAQSTYFLNGSKCRRRDITDIFLGTGLGPRSYAIIEQGMISRLIESKPQELRIFIEEAAGISKYKERRKETETRIKHTRDNLDRLEDVREELGSQLDKLKRQAATARRFKELKKQERTYKAELYALKWHKYNEQLNLFERDRAEREAQLEAFVAEQRGGELGMLKYKEQHTDLADKVQAAQQTNFKISNDITRLEQQIVHAQDSHQKNHQALEQVTASINDASEHLALEQERLELMFEELDMLLPEKEMVDEQLELQQEQMLNAEQEYEDWQAAWERKQRNIAQSSQSVQVLQTKVQSLKTQQTRISQRIQDLHRELADMDDAQLQLQIEQHQNDISKHTDEMHVLESALGAAKQTLEQIESERLLIDECVQELNTTHLKITAEHDSLAKWQQEYLHAQSADLPNILTKQGIAIQTSLLASVTVEQDWQKAIESCVAHFGDSTLVDKLPIELDSLTQAQLHTSSSRPADNNSLASVVKSGGIPGWFHNIAIEPINDFGQSRWLAWVDVDGVIRGDGWISIGGLAGSNSNQVLQRIARIDELGLEQERCALELEQASRELELCENKKREAHENCQAAEVELRQVTQNLSETKVELKLLTQQQQQHDVLVSKLNVEIGSLQEQLEQEQETELLLEEELSFAVEQQHEVSEHLETLEAEKRGLQDNLNQGRQNLEALKNQAHQIALKIQNFHVQKDALNQNVQRGKQHLATLEQRQSQLQQALNSDEDPVALLKAELESLLHEKLEQEEALQEFQTALAEVAQQIAELEQGQSGVMSKLENMRNEIAAIKLDSEGARVRAQNMLDTLNDMDQPLKPVLESMPAEAEEMEWTQRLEKTSNSISRLGAINLAAIDEYEVQGQRKAYLDEQYMDLVAALETLESAIRKIDRESKAKFKATYEQVNADLQHLFPKVFGGGSAYLELTADDLLETGVTIMARPPGKKNSTIHLLSGGEKALTALSLVFSIFRLNPAPFCMLDEVDAPLDDANVGRFCKLVKEMSETVQFIYISHNKVAMEMATHLTGVTMQEPGVSRLVAVDIQEAVKMAEAS